jgi:hypothetical protein
MYARGILFGKMKYELGDHSYVRCPENHLVADIEFKTKGYFSGTYNAIGGTIKNEQTGEVLYELSGLWNGEMDLKDVHVRPAYFPSLLPDSTLTENRPTKKTSCLMRHTQSIHLLWSDPWRSKESGNRSGYGTRRFKRFWPGTMKLQRTKRPRSKTANETRPRNAPMKESNGVLDFSVPSKADQVGQMRAKKTSTGSSTLKCKSDPSNAK